MATAMLADRGLRRKMTQGDTPKPPKKETKRKSSSKSVRAEQNNNVKRQRVSGDAKEDMFVSYQPWVIQTYGDLAKTKTITTKKYARILRTLRGEEVASADNSKFRFWVKAKGFHVGKPPGYDAKPADAIVGRYSVCDADEGIPPTSDQLTGSAKDPSLYVPNTPLKACIIGAKTKKLLHVGIRNKYCYVCARSSSQPLHHNCYKNWNASSTAMEADIIVEGFQKSVKVHKLIYGRVIGDGDSSVYKKLTEAAPYGPTFVIEKIECRNHLLRNYLNKLSDISKDTKYPIALRRKVTNTDTLGRFRNAVTKAIEYRKEGRESFSIKACWLKKDILNGPKHIFGDHSTCDNYFCKKSKERENSNGEPIYRKVAVVENFFDIIYNVHVELEGRPGKHAGQKRTYRTITETYAFLPREAVTRFLLGCTDCQRHPRSPSPVSVLPTPSPSPTLPLVPTSAPVLPLATLPQAPQPAISQSTPPQLTPPTSQVDPPPEIAYTERNLYLDFGKPAKTAAECKSPQPIPAYVTANISSQSQTLDLSQKCADISQSQPKIDGPLRTSTPEPKRSSNPLDVCNLTSRDPPKSPPKKRHLNHLSDNSQPPPAPPKLWSPVDGIEKEQSLKKQALMPAEIDYSLPITTTYLKYMRSLGCTDEDALKFENKNENLATPEPSETTNEEDHFSGTGAMKDTDKLKLMLLAWNYHNQTQGNRNGSGDIPDLSALPGGEEMAGLWAQYHSALGLSKGKATPPVPRDQSSPVNADTGSAHDETSSSGNKEDEDDDDDESDDKIDTHTHDPERLKAFNMFVRLFVDENLDRMVPISKQPKEKIQAIIDSCTRQFPEFAERARKRIRTYLKSCRRNKRARDPNSSWDSTRPTPAHLTSVQAEQILATACENESHNAKRMRLGLEPVSQPMPLLPGATPTDTTAAISRSIDLPGNPPVKLEIDTTSGVFPSSTTPSTTPNSISKGISLTPDIKPTGLSVSSAGLSTTPLNGMGISTTPGSAPTAMYRPNFSQAFQRAGPYPLFPGQPFSAGGGLLTNGPTDLSMKQKPLLNHKLSTGEMAAVRQLITGYRESAAFLLRSADELEQLLLQQQ